MFDPKNCANRVSGAEELAGILVYLWDKLMSFAKVVRLSKYMSLGIRLNEASRELENCMAKAEKLESANGKLRDEVYAERRKNTELDHKFRDFERETKSKLNSNDLYIKALNRFSPLADESKIHLSPIYNCTNQKARALLNQEGGGIASLLVVEQVKSPSVWGVYWSLALAADIATETATMQDMGEDFVSGELVNKLALIIGEIQQSRLLRESIEIAVSSIYGGKKPNIKEDCVGADLLFIVAGKKLVPRGGIRLVWIQAKLNGREQDPYLLDFWREKNSKGYQFDALRAVHKPKIGSVSLYIQYSPSIPFIAGLSVSDMPANAPESRSESRVSLKEKGCRFQELVAWVISTNEIGQFASPEDVLDFLDSASGNSLVPLNIITAHGARDEEGQMVLSKIQKRYKALRIERGLEIAPVIERELTRGR